LRYITTLRDNWTEKEEDLKLHSVLVRKDTWDKLLSTKTETSIYSDSTFLEHKKSAHQMFLMFEERMLSPEKFFLDYFLEKFKEDPDYFFDTVRQDLRNKNKFYRYFLQEQYNHVMMETPQASTESFLKDYFLGKSKVLREDVLMFLDRAAQFSHVQKMMMYLRKNWSPTVWAATQDPEWSFLEDFNSWCATTAKSEQGE
jgi:hypothetical protein